ncbi:MAG TPA: CDP-glucose 4,6-dehydratase [Stellaceae bacterium]|nr:CDP-glucose 4,6-dehydratase [Stellaceae bacterium]
MLDRAFWRGRRVFLTGHTGFKGAWLSLWLQRLGARVTGYSIDVPTEPSLFMAARIGDGMTDGRGDVRDCDALSKAMREAAPEIVIHAAAQALVRASYADPIGTFATNIMGTAHLLEAARSCAGIKAVLIVTSDKCYENREWVWGYRESDAMGGYDPYSASKGAAEIVTASMRNAYFQPEAYRDHGVAVASARAGNVIGGGDWSADRIVPDLMRAFASGVPAMIRNPRAIRPWQYVLDPLAGYLLLCERLCREGPTFAEAWNFGPDLSGVRSVAELADAAARLWGTGAATQNAEGPEPHEAAILRLDAAKARLRLGWRPKMDCDTALLLAVEWYRAFYAGQDVRALSDRQLDRWHEMA